MIAWEKITPEETALIDSIVTKAMEYDTTFTKFGLHMDGPARDRVAGFIERSR